MSLGGPRASIRSGSSGRFRSHIINEINVTPLVDVMLVLLIIFMVTTPMMVADIKVDLPSSKQSPTSSKQDQVTVTIDNNGKVFVNSEPVPLNKLASEVNKATKGNKDTRIFLRGDRKIDYGKVIEIFSYLHQAGFQKVALVTQAQDK